MVSQRAALVVSSMVEAVRWRSNTLYYVVRLRRRVGRCASQSDWFFNSVGSLGRTRLGPTARLWTMSIWVTGKARMFGNRLLLVYFLVIVE